MAALVRAVFRFHWILWMECAGLPMAPNGINTVSISIDTFAILLIERIHFAVSYADCQVPSIGRQLLTQCCIWHVVEQSAFRTIGSVCRVWGAFMRLPHPICISGEMHAADNKRTAIPCSASACLRKWHYRFQPHAFCSERSMNGSGSLNKRRTQCAYRFKWTNEWRVCRRFEAKINK